MKYTEAAPTEKQTLIFTDLDGSLLDHYSYSFDAATPLLRYLEHQQIPVICTTSKTYAELQPLRRNLNNNAPFIVENGAAVFIPRNSFPAAMDGGGPECIEYLDYQCYAFSKRRDYWQHLLESVRPQFEGKFTTFAEMGVDGICAATGLSPEQAELANNRLFGEPVMWLGDEHSKEAFIENMLKSGAKVLHGGRFMHISGACDKGKALLWLAGQYQQQCSSQLQTIAIGDSDNDIAMLEAADRALIVRSPVHEPPQLHNQQHYLISSNTGPVGWAEGLTQLLNIKEKITGIQSHG